MNVGKSTVDKWARTLKSERSGGVTQGTPISADAQKIRQFERENQQLKLEK